MHAGLKVEPRGGKFPQSSENGHFRSWGASLPGAMDRGPGRFRSRLLQGCIRLHEIGPAGCLGGCEVSVDWR